MGRCMRAEDLRPLARQQECLYLTLYVPAFGSKQGFQLLQRFWMQRELVLPPTKRQSEKADRSADTLAKASDT